MANKKYFLYGDNRVSRDFQYVFENLEICGVVDKIGKLPLRNTYDQLILCDFPGKSKDIKRSELEGAGLRYQKDFLLEEDFFGTLDFAFGIKNSRKKIVIWGTGRIADEFVANNPQYEIAFYIDSYKKDKVHNGKPVLKPEDIRSFDRIFIIVAVMKNDEIILWLKNQKLKDTVDYSDYQRFMWLPSKLIRKTIFDKHVYQMNCDTMLNHLEILHLGNTRVCCTTFVKPDIGNLMEQSSEMVWNSNLHRILALSTQNKTYTFCDKKMCPLFIGCEKKSDTGDFYAEYRKITTYPKVVALGFDSTCNLACETCRMKTHTAQGEELEAAMQVADRVTTDFVGKCDFLIMAGDGEVFASKAYRRIYESLESAHPQCIRLLSNGTLFTPQNWKNFIRNKRSKIMLTVSVDAATKETYEQIRKNGNFEKLCENMKFASELRKAGALAYFRMNFVVQMKNLNEMIPFVEWGKKLGADKVFFTKILNWGTYTDEEFSKVSVMESDGYTPRQELKKILDNPVMKSGIVDLGTIQYNHKSDRVEDVENYYMWELEKDVPGLFE